MGDTLIVETHRSIGYRDAGVIDSNWPQAVDQCLNNGFQVIDSHIDGVAILKRTLIVSASAAVIAVIIALLSRFFFSSSRWADSFFWALNSSDGKYSLPVLLSGAIVLTFQFRQPQPRSIALLTFFAAAYLSNVAYNICVFILNLISWAFFFRG